MKQQRKTVARKQVDRGPRPADRPIGLLVADVSYRRAVEACLPGRDMGWVGIEEFKDGRKLITLASDSIANAFTGTLYFRDALGWQFNDLASCEAFAHAILAAVAKARDVGIGGKAKRTA